MEQRPDFSFHKSERLCSKRVIDTLFTAGNKAMSAFPIRVVFMLLPAEEKMPPASILVSVSKRHFKRAVRRNRAKRLIREAYRKNKYLITDILKAQNQRIAIAFLWLSDRLYSAAEVERRVNHLLIRISEHISPSPSAMPAHEPTV